MHASLRLGLTLAALMTFAAGVSAQETPKSFVCTFKSGSALAYNKSVFRSKPAKPIAFDIVNIDLEGQKADLMSTSGKGNLRVVRALGANHFMEVVMEGYLTVTTIYSKDAKRGTYPAVHSRHFGILGEPVIAQYTGFCAAK